jgi:hypothetical protein
MVKKKIPIDEVSLAWEAIRRKPQRIGLGSTEGKKEVNEEEKTEENENLEQAIIPKQKNEFVSILPSAKEERIQNLERSLDAGPVKEEKEKKPKEVQYGFKQSAKKYSTGESLTAFRSEELVRPEQTIRQIIRVPQMRDSFHEARQVREFMPPSPDEERQYSFDKFSELKTTELNNPLKSRDLMKAKYTREEE